MMSYGNITKEELIFLIEFNNNEKIKIEQLKRDYTSISLRRVIQNKLSNIKKFPISLNEIDRKIELITKLKHFRMIKEQLNCFTEDVLSIDYKELENNKYLYSK